MDLVIEDSFDSLEAHQVWQLVDDYGPLTTSPLVDPLNRSPLPVSPIHIVTCIDTIERLNNIPCICSINIIIDIYNRSVILSTRIGKCYS